jgi:hypothetical protein
VHQALGEGVAEEASVRVAHSLSREGTEATDLTNGATETTKGTKKTHFLKT